MAPIIKDDEEQRREDEQRRRDEEKRQPGASQRPYDPPRAAPPMGPGSPKLPPQRPYDPKRAKPGGGGVLGGEAGAPAEPVQYVPNIPNELAPEDRWMMFAQQAADQRYPRLRNGIDYLIGRKTYDGPVELIYCEEAGQQIDMALVQEDAQKMSDADPTNPEALESQTSLASSYHAHDAGEAQKPDPR